MNIAALQRKYKSWWLLLPITILLIASGLGLHFYRLRQADQSPPPERAPWALQTGRVELTPVERGFETSAQISAPREIFLSPQIPGTVLKVGPRAGVAVRRGRLLVLIDASEIARDLGALEQQRTAADADADYAGKQQARIDALLAEGGVSQAQADQARTAAAAAAARADALAQQVAALRVKLGYAEIRAPADAIVAERMVEAGDTIGPGRAVYRLTAGRGAVVRASVPAVVLAEVHVGDPLELHGAGPSLRFPITRVAPAVDATGLGAVEADVSTAPFGLPSGSIVGARLITHTTASSLSVPEAGVLGHDGSAKVFVVRPAPEPGRPATVQVVPVRVISVGSQRVAVNGDLHAGEAVVVAQTATLAQLRDGDPVVTQSTDKEPTP